ncbi:hypothetical protein FIE12Z_3933, partial [Fusarium flagelliforme]
EPAPAPESAEHTELKEKHHDLTIKLEATAENAGRLQLSVDTLTAERDEITQKLTTLQEEATALQAKADEVTTDRDDLKGKLTAAEEQIATLIAERDELNKKLETAEREAVILNALRTENNNLMKKLDEAKKAQKQATSKVNSLETQIAALVAQIHSGGGVAAVRSSSKGRKGPKDPKRAQELVIVRDPRDGGKGLSSIVRRKNLNSAAARSSSQSDGSADS